MFLSEENVAWPDAQTHAEWFLTTLIQDNAINYSQDKTFHNWSFGYYVGNAEYRLQQIHKIDLGMPEFDLTFGSSRQLWEQCHIVAKEILNRLDARLSVTICSN